MRAFLRSSGPNSHGCCRHCRRAPSVAFTTPASSSGFNDSDGAVADRAPREPGNNQEAYRGSLSSVLRAQTTGEKQGFMKAEAGEVVATVQAVMLADARLRGRREQRLRGLEVGGDEPLGEAGVDRGQEVTRRRGLSLLLP